MLKLVLHIVSYTKTNENDDSNLFKIITFEGGVGGTIYYFVRFGGRDNISFRSFWHRRRYDSVCFGWLPCLPGCLVSHVFPSDSYYCVLHFLFWVFTHVFQYASTVDHCYNI